MTITIDVSGSGALMHGTDREDNDLLRPIGWRWSFRMKCLYLARNLRPETIRWKVEQTITALAPREVEVTGADEVETDEERAERMHERDKALVGVHEARAERAATEADVRLGMARALGDMIPFGQPILVGHHSEKRHRSHLNKIDTNMRKGVEAHKESVAEERLAASAAARVAAREKRAAGDQFGPDDIEVGDLIQTPWSDALVLRVSARSVTVPSFVMGLPFTDTLPYRKVRGVTHKFSDQTRAAVTEALAQIKAHRAQYKDR